MIYLDNNATTKVDEKVLKEMLPYLQNEYANPSSMYDFAKKPAAAIKEARAKIRDFLGANNEKEIVRIGKHSGDILDDRSLLQYLLHFLRNLRKFSAFRKFRISFSM